MFKFYWCFCFTIPFLLLVSCGNLQLRVVDDSFLQADTVSLRPFLPAPVAETHPDSFNYQYEMLADSLDGAIYPFHFFFNDTLPYAFPKGVTTFRGNNLRNGAMYGLAAMPEQQFEKVWTNHIGRMDKWTGVGWTGQAAVVKWDREVLALSNVIDTFKNQDEFVEAICGTLDGKVYFYDLYSGKPSRPIITLPSSIKGSVWVDPRGYPLLYVGQGIDRDANKKKAAIGFYIYSLLDGSQLHYVNGIDTFAFRKWGAFDGNGLVCKETDEMFLVGENGLVYAGKLNTQFDKKQGRISVRPQWYKYHYKTSKNTRYRLGTENSVAAYRHYAFFADNSGLLQCMDMNTLSPVWVQYLDDDTDASVALDEEAEGVFLYTGCEVDLRAKDDSAYLRKINAATGEQIWKKSYLCAYDTAVNGGLLSSPLIGLHNLNHLVFFNVAKTGGKKCGKLLAFNKITGELAWEYVSKNYSWSSPVAVYNENHEGFIILADSKGMLCLFDGLSGKILHSLNLGGENIEASPVVYEDMLVIGTRGKKIHGIKIK